MKKVMFAIAMFTGLTLSAMACDAGKGVAIPARVALPADGSEVVIPFDYTDCGDSAPETVTFTVSSKALAGLFLYLKDTTTNVTYYGAYYLNGVASVDYDSPVVFYDIPARGHKLEIHVYSQDTGINVSAQGENTGAKFTRTQSSR
jgi:hypothetical protein